MTGSNRDNANKGKGNHQPGQTYGGGGGALREGAQGSHPDPDFKQHPKDSSDAPRSGEKPPKAPTDDGE